MKRVKLYTSVAQVDGVTYSPGDVIELSDEDAQYLIDHGQGVETTDQVTDVAAREASEGTDHAIRVDVQHGESQDIITVVPSDPDKNSRPPRAATILILRRLTTPRQLVATVPAMSPRVPLTPLPQSRPLRPLRPSRPLMPLQSRPTRHRRSPLIPLPLMMLVMRLALMLLQNRPLMPLQLTML